MFQSGVILLVRSPLFHIFLLFSTQYYSGTHSRCETALPKRNGLLLCISRSNVSSWISPTNILNYALAVVYFIESDELIRNCCNNK